MINENYHGEIYHFTSLIQASWICDDDCLDARITSSEFSEYEKQVPTISFTRDKNYNIQGGGNNTVVRFVFDGDTIQNIRNARLRPFAYNNGKGEAEERLYNIDINPLHKYLNRIEIDVVYDEYSWASDRNFDEEGELYEEFMERYPDLDDDELNRKITDYLINKISKNKLFKNKVKITYKNLQTENMNKKLISLSENDLHRIVKESVNRTLNEIASNEEMMAARAALPKIRRLYNQTLQSIDALMAECEQFPSEIVKYNALLPGCREAKRHLELFFKGLV